MVVIDQHVLWNFFASLLGFLCFYTLRRNNYRNGSKAKPKKKNFPEEFGNMDHLAFSNLHSTMQARKNERITQSKKQQKLSSISDIERAGNPGLVGQSSSSSCSEDDSNASPELEGEETPSLGTKGPAALNSKGKTRAGRGSASDTQSVYARKKREKINERLRTLQNLVPHGTKVDITTMLEEAVEYVKFLQLQIKLLSSSDLWMYAPIAYNGMDIGLDRKVTVLNNL